MGRGESAVYSEDSAGDEEPLVIENPDGSLHHGLPAGKRYKKARPETPPGDRLAREWVAWDPELLVQVERLYSRHERVFLILIFLQFLLENSFNALLIKHSASTAAEIQKSYPFMNDEKARYVFWAIVGTAVIFATSYYIVAAMAVWERRTRWMKIFSDMAVIGILGQVLFAYINRFNLILFCLRFLVFAHSRFLLSVLDGSARIIIRRQVVQPPGDQPATPPEDIVIDV
jgi:hypothetical protein